MFRSKVIKDNKHLSIDEVINLERYKSRISHLFLHQGDWKNIDEFKDLISQLEKRSLSEGKRICCTFTKQPEIILFSIYKKNDKPEIILFNSHKADINPKDS